MLPLTERGNRGLVTEGPGTFGALIALVSVGALRAVLYSSAPHAAKARTGGLRDRRARRACVSLEQVGAMHEMERVLH